MLFWISQQILISLVVIVLIHSIYTFLQANLTTPKIRDMVNRPIEQYKEIYQTLSEPKAEEDSSNMKNELQNYLRELSSSIKTKNPKELSGNQFGNQFADNFQTI